MPAGIRWSHLLETLGSNLTFGFVVGWLLRDPDADEREAALMSPSTF
jgi:hypothetical protein